ncbi:MAG: hypothetical protein DBY32_11375 [Phascolarctobacterium sp.]|nr:MAG: hypothetical protein DBY32_11375 [Phascolarctobacterium sp.]
MKVRDFEEMYDKGVRKFRLDMVMCSDASRGFEEDEVVTISEYDNNFAYVGKHPFLVSQLEPITDDCVPAKVDAHYQTAVQPIEVMQANMTREELIGFLKGNIIKYACRCGRKDDVRKETAKILQYAQWLDDVTNGKQIEIAKEDK